MLIRKDAQIPRFTWTFYLFSLNDEISTNKALSDSLILEKADYFYIGDAAMQTLSTSESGESSASAHALQGRHSSGEPYTDALGGFRHLVCLQYE